VPAPQTEEIKCTRSGGHRHYTNLLVLAVQFFLSRSGLCAPALLVIRRRVIILSCLTYLACSEPNSRPNRSRQFRDLIQLFMQILYHVFGYSKYSIATAMSRGHLRCAMYLSCSYPGTCFRSPHLVAVCNGFQLLSVCHLWAPTSAAPGTRKT